MKNCPFRSKSVLLPKKDATQFLCVQTVSGRVVGHSRGPYLSVQQCLVGPLLGENLAETDSHPFKMSLRTVYVAPKNAI